MEIRTVLSGVRNPEGPVSLPDGSWVFTEMDASAISMLTAEGEHKTIAVTGLPNGLALGADGRYWVADAVWRALLAVSPDGQIETVSKGSGDDPFLLPNDLCFGPDGMIYMTDSGVLLSEMRKSSDPMAAYDLAYDGRLYVIDPRSGGSRVLDRGFRLTNGIAFGPGGEYLYLNETLSGQIFRYRFGEWKRELFGNVLQKPAREFGRVAGPDGMKFDREGNLYVAVIAQDITVLARDGSVLKRIPLPGDNPTNLAFDANGSNQMLVTEAARNELLLVTTPCAGLELYYEKQSGERR